jgi:hypothetical protein
MSGSVSRMVVRTRDRFDVPLADVYESLSYCYAHIDEMRKLEMENESAFERVRKPSLKPKETAK